MKAITVLLLVCAACREDVEMFPISPGGGGGGGTTFVDAAVDAPAGDGGTMLTGRVCLINDPRNPTACAATGAGNLSVMLGSQTATTAADGAFTITRPAGAGLVWRVSGTGTISSALLASSGATIPALDQTIYQQMIAASSAPSGDNTGAIIAKLTHNGVAITGAVATTTPAPLGDVFYDGASIDQWDLTSTGSFGVVWVPGLDAGTVSMQVGNATVTGIPVFADTITYVFAEL
jgi:hypothetical protein